MKTENLSWVEAVRALADGHKIKDKMGYMYWIEGEIPMFGHINGEINVFAGDFQVGYAPFHVIKPEEKRLSFEQAVAVIQFGKASKLQLL